MGQLIDKILCPSHEEDTPSCAVYPDGSGYCFGCSTYFPRLSDPKPVQKLPPENLESKLAYIYKLDLTKHRGLSFFADAEGYYVIWPNAPYYKLRRWDDANRSKYLCPSGHQKPWFILNNGTQNAKVCAIIEGEINALSLEQAYPYLDIYCPGGVGNFTDSAAKQALHILKNYDKIHIIVDSDQPGVTAAIKLKKLLQPPCLDVVIHLMEEDANNILVNHGVSELQKILGLT